MSSGTEEAPRSSIVTEKRDTAFLNSIRRPMNSSIII